MIVIDLTRQRGRARRSGLAAAVAAQRRVAHSGHVRSTLQLASALSDAMGPRTTDARPHAEHRRGRYGARRAGGYVRTHRKHSRVGLQSRLSLEFFLSEERAPIGVLYDLVVKLKRIIIIVVVEVEMPLKCPDDELVKHD